LKNSFLWVLLFCFSGVFAQEIETPYKNKKLPFSKDTIAIDNVSINQSFSKFLTNKAILLILRFIKSISKSQTDF